MPLAVPSDSCVGEATALVGETFVWMRFSLCFLVTDVFVCEKSLFLVNIGLCDCISGRSQSAGIQGLGTLETTEPPGIQPRNAGRLGFQKLKQKFLLIFDRPEAKASAEAAEVGATFRGLMPCFDVVYPKYKRPTCQTLQFSRIASLIEI